MPPRGEPTVLAGLRLPGRAAPVDLTLRGDRIDAITPARSGASRLLLPLLTDAHVHLDKTLTAARLPRAAVSLLDAIDLAAADRARWDVADIRRRASAALARAERHGTGRMRSHVDWTEAAVPLAWPVLQEIRAEWRGRVELQLAALVPLDLVPEAGAAVAARVAEDGGVLGAFVHGQAELEARLARLFDLAERHDLPLDFHVDETLDPAARGVDAILAEAERRRLGSRVVCGHACALAERPEAEVRPLLDRLAAAGVALCVLPATNAGLQDRAAGRTPRRRGLAPLREAREAGMAVFLASDNCRDAFHPWGDYDLWDIFRAALPWAHLQAGSWLDAITDAPARLFAAPPGPRVGAKADFLLLAGEDADDAASRAGADRQVWRNGRRIRFGERDQRLRDEGEEP